MVRDIQQEKINTVIAYKIDRLTRSPKDFYQLIEIFEKYGVSFISVTERFDTSTPSGRLLRNIMLTFAQFERELIGERIRDKLREKAKKGYWHSTRPFGYKRENKKLIIDPQEAQVVRRIFELYLATSSVNQVYKTLKSENVLNKNGLPFSVSQLSEMLKRVVYIGKVQYKDKVYQGVHKPIISEEIFDAAQKVEKRKIKKRKVANHAIFPGIVRCKECGSVMIAVFSTKVTKGRPNRYFYYRCSAISRRDSSFCSTRYVSVDRFDAHVLENLRNVAQNTQYLESLIFTLNFQPQGKSKGVEMGDYKVEKLREILSRISEVAKLESINEKRTIIKRHIKNIIYSKEAIEVNIIYPLTDKELLRPEQSSAAFFCRRTKKCRRPIYNNRKTAASAETAVRNNFLVELAGVEPASEKAAAKVTTSVAPIFVSSRI